MKLASLIDQFQGEGESPFKQPRLFILFLSPHKLRKDTVICVTTVITSIKPLIYNAWLSDETKNVCVIDRHRPSPYRHHERWFQWFLRHPTEALRHRPSPTAAGKAEKMGHFLQKVTLMTQMTVLPEAFMDRSLVEVGEGPLKNLRGLIDKVQRRGIAPVMQGIFLRRKTLDGPMPPAWSELRCRPEPGMVFSLPLSKIGMKCLRHRGSDIHG